MGGDWKMSLRQLKVERTLERRRELFRLGRLRHYKQTGNVKLQKKWRKLWHDATAKRQALDKKIAANENATATSDKGLDMLMREEGVVPYAYNDPAGHATFGVGHLIHLGNVTDADRRRWGTKTNPRRDLVMPTLRADIRKFEKTVNDSVKVNLKQHQFDALISLAFNIGQGGFASSTVVKRLNTHDFRGAADAILMWDNPVMLRARRERERNLFLTGKYS
jgi:lysozyme